jgi:PAS domain S-box-containing protein
MRSNPVPSLSAFLGLSLAYMVSGALGLLLAVPPGYATAVFPPAGLAIAATFIGGARTLPWICLGSFLLNLYAGAAGIHELTAVAAAVAGAIAAASTLQGALGGWALRRLIGYPAALDNPRDLSRFLLLTPAVCWTAASLSLAAMWLLGAIEPADLGISWLTWWIGDTLGVLVVFPLVMVLAGEPRDVWRKRAWPVALPMLLCFALFVAIFVKVSAWENDQSLLEFRLLSQRITDRIQERLGREQVFLEQLERSFAAKSTPVTRQNFRMLVRDLPQRFPTVQAVEWAPRVARSERAGFEAQQRTELPGFGIRERDAAGALVPAADRNVLYPVSFVEPLQGNEGAVGFDLASEAARRAAIVKAVESGQIAATAPLRLVQAPSDRTGVLLTVAVSDAPDGPGILVLALRMSAFMQSVMSDAGKDIEFQLADRDSGLSLLGAASVPAKPLYEQSFAFAGRSYLARAAPTKDYLASHRGWESLAVLMAGVLGTGLLGALLMLSTGERRRVESLLEDRTRERDRIWQVSEDLLGVGNFAGYFVSFNPAWTRVLGWSEDEIRRMHVDELRHPDDLSIGLEGRKRLAEGVPTVRMENRFRCKDGGYRWIYWTMTAENGLIYVIGRDVTSEKAAATTLRRAEEQLRQSQKMQALGQLTGGIAHDFNNLLTVIIGGLEIVERATTESAVRVRKVISAAMTGALRAATLTQRLLAYAQKQPLNPRVVDLNQLIISMADLVRQTHGESIECDFALGDTVGCCFCDPSQLETAVLNLVINARDAMPQGGKLRIETALTAIDEASTGARELPSGSYLVLSVSDNGSGMSPATRAAAFEPFFTTKEPGKGTGLGLSTVYGFVKQSHGHVDIESELGRGTTVTILLPSVAPAAQAEPAAAAAPAARRVSSAPAETILLVEDDEQVRGYVADMLRDLGYAVLVAENAEAAVASLAQSRERIDLLLTDVVLPGMNGRELAERAREIRPGIRALFMTGYARDVIVHQGRLDPGIDLIEKPFRREALATRIRLLLDHGAWATESSPVTEPAAEG